MTVAATAYGAVAVASEATPRTAADRNDALDFTKGTLVLIMVLYHWFNYFVALESEVYRYLRFLTPSFILITGFIVSHVYLTKQATGDRRVYRRLFERGAKLLVLFTILNLSASLLVQRNYNGAELGIGAFVAHGYQVYVTGSGPAVFDVLVPIAYVLLLAPVLLAAGRVFRYSIHLAAAVTLAAALVTSATGIAIANLQMMSIALLGMAAGTVPISRIHHALRRPTLLLLLLFGYAAYLVAVTLWDVLFPLQVAGVCLSVMLIYLVGNRVGADGFLQRLTIELGKYSLFAYIVQVALLQVQRRLFQGVGLHDAGLLVPFAASLFLTALSVRSLSLARNRSTMVDRAYRAVFA